MKVLFSNPPWWENKEGRFRKRWRAGVRAGSRWPFTYISNCSPDRFKFGEYLPYPFFMGYATTYAQKATGADVRFRDSIALRESYKTYFNHLEKERYEYIFIEIATPSWEHDRQLIDKIRKHLPETKIVERPYAKSFAVYPLLQCGKIYCPLHRRGIKSNLSSR